MAKQAILIQRQEDWPGNPGWWRYSRPVLRHVNNLPEISESVRWSFVYKRSDVVSAQKSWDISYPNG